MKQSTILHLGLACCGLIQHGVAQDSNEATPPPQVDTERITVYDTRLNSLEAPTETGSRLGVPLSDIPASVFNIDQLTIRTRGFRTAQEAVESVVGFTGANSPGNGATFSTRGFAGDNISQLWDGVRLLNPAMSARPIDPFNLAGIEIIKGPASVLHGEGAVDGSGYPSASWSRCGSRAPSS